MVSSSVMGDAIRQAPASRSLIAELVGSSTVIERKVVMPPVGVELSPPYTDNPFHRVLQEIKHQTAARGRGDADARRRWALPRPTDDPCEETAVQRPIAGPQRSDVRHCVGRVVLDAARFAGAALPRRSLRSTRNNLGMFPFGWRSLCGDHARATGRAVLWGVDSTESADLIRLYLDDRLDNRFLRGRTSLPHAVQAARISRVRLAATTASPACHPSTSSAAKVKFAWCSAATRGSSRSASRGNCPSRCCRNACVGPRLGPDLSPSFRSHRHDAQRQRCRADGSKPRRRRRSGVYGVAGNDIGDGDVDRAAVRGGGAEQFDDGVGGGRADALGESAKVCAVACGHFHMHRA